MYKMFKTETDLLDILADKVYHNKDLFGWNIPKNFFSSKEEKCCKNNSLNKQELDEIEKYRDNDGFINLKNVKCIDKLNEIIELVDKKNKLSLEGNNDDVESMAKDLVDDILKIADVDTLKVNIKTPNGSTTMTFGDTESNDNDEPDGCDYGPREKKEKCYDNDEPDGCDYGPREKKEKCCGKFKKETTISEAHSTKSKETDNSSTTKVACEETKKSQELPQINEITPKNKIQLVSVGGIVNNLFYNAVRYICETQYFQGDIVYTDFDNEQPGKFDGAVLIPNIWNKIYEDAAADFVEQMIQDNIKVWIINPETFEIKEIKSPFDLYDYTMTRIQEISY